MRKLSGLRRRAVVLAAMAAVLGLFPVMVHVHLPHWFVFVCIGLQVILLSLAISFLVRSKHANQGC
ncbi:MAG: hypothetical protein WB622_12795 [Acidobacteriaceae bacterium]|jgi:uncharacterized membrane protein